jgi:cystathionine beta-lyase
VENPLTVLTTEELRARRSIKWRAVDADVLPLWIAEMDTPLAPPIAGALRLAVDRGDTGYAHPGGLPAAFAAYARRRFDWAPDPAQMLMVPDVVQGITEVIRATTEPGDGILINTPAYPPFFSCVREAGRRIVESPLARDPGGRYRLDLAALDRDLASPEVTAYLLCNPHNPTGLVLTRQELATVAELAGFHGVRVLSDEVHAPLVHPGAVHTPFATVAAEAARSAIIFTSASKAWNLPGLKAALVVAGGDPGWAALSRVPGSAAMGTSLFGVIAGEVAFGEGEEWLASVMAGLDHNRTHLTDLLAEHLPGVGYVVPDATYLAWLDLRGLGLGEDPAAALLERGRVALSNGPLFGDLGKGFARLNFATSPARLAEAVERMARACQGIAPDHPVPA